MKFIMLTSSDRYFWVISLIWAACQVTESLSLETKAKLPKEILQSLKNANASEVKNILKNTRRIIFGMEATEKRPYMVYLKLPANNAKFQEYKRWLCGGVIIHEEYILTSAACIEDVKHFYVVSGTFKFSYADDRYNNICIKNGAKKAIWKCIPKNYVFDGHENDNIRWMNNDIAVVKLEDEFDFTRRIRGCDYAPRPVCYNNQTVSHEAPGVLASIAGWGSTDKYNDWVNTRRGVPSRRADIDTQNLLESPVEIIDKHECKQRWGRRYYNIITNYMICTMDFQAELSEMCQEKYVDCQEIESETGEEEERRSYNPSPDEMLIHSSNHNYSIQRRAFRPHLGGFCENDHGGPLVYGEGVESVVIGIISACLVKERTNKCYGPFLYTSVFKNRVLINCAIYKTAGQDCDKLFRAAGTHEEMEMSWADHPDGPAKNELKAMRRRDGENSTVAAKNETSKKEDSPIQHAVVDEEKKKVPNDTLKQSNVLNKTAT